MGCNNSKNEINLGSSGSTDEEDEDEGLLINRRKWGVTPLPEIGTDPGFSGQAKSGGTAFYIQDENSNPKRLPPRRLQKLPSKRLTMEDLMRKQQEYEMKREQRIKERVSKTKGSRNAIQKREFERSQDIYSKCEKRLKRGENNRQQILDKKVDKIKEHHKKIEVVRRKSVVKDDLNLSGKMEHDSDYNKSESESWDNDSLRNIYDQMEYITPASAITRNVTSINSEINEFFS